VRAEGSEEDYRRAVEERVELLFKLGSVTASITSFHLQIATRIVFKLAKSLERRRSTLCIPRYA